MRLQGISVIICCYNSTKRITHTLEHLFAQKNTIKFSWEIIVVDNNSSDETATKSAELYKQSSSSIPFKVVLEPNPGLSNARQAGFDASKYEIVLMVDDDNWLSSNYLDGIWNAFQTDSSIGMVGGLGIPELSNPAPEWFDRYAYCYATGPQTENEERGFTENLYGAGLALKLSVLDRLKENGFSSLLSDRIGETLISGGDTELCFAYRMAGFNLLYEPSISFKHELPASRINWNYLKRLFYGFGVTKSKLDMYTACLRGQQLPMDGKLPFWFNRAFFLWKQSFKDKWMLLKSRVLSMEGNDDLLVALAKKGQIDGIWSMRLVYISLYEKVYDLKKRLDSDG